MAVATSAGWGIVGRVSGHLLNLGWRRDGSLGLRVGGAAVKEEAEIEALTWGGDIEAVAGDAATLAREGIRGRIIRS